MSSLSAWLSGVPARISALKWPDGESDLSAHSDREGTAVLDGRVVRWRAFVTDTPNTVVYTVDATRDLPVFEHVATLDYAVHDLAIVPEIGFATVEWRAHESIVILRSHSMSGEKQQETSVHAQAAYGQLSVYGTSVALCICSGDASVEWADLAYNMKFADQIGYVGSPADGFEDLVGHKIIVWDADSGSVQHCPIPQDTGCLMTHSADFEFLTPDKIVLAGRSSEFLEVPILKCFRTAAGGDDEPLAFTVGEVTNQETVSEMVGHPGSTEPSAIFVHDHGTGRISVFRRQLIEGGVSTSRLSEDPPGLCETFGHPDHVRTLRGSVSRPACVAGDRVLVQHGSYFEPSFHVLDFNQTRLSEMLSKSDSERDRLRDELQRAGARVRVVTRQYFMTEDEEVGQEYRNPSVAIAPPELREHVKGLQGREKDALVYDEWPQEPRDPTRWGFVKTELPMLDRPMTMVAILRDVSLRSRKRDRRGEFCTSNDATTLGLTWNREHVDIESIVSSI